MISAEISCDIASLAIEAGDTIFTMANDISSDGGFNVYIYLDPKDIETSEDAEFMRLCVARSNAFQQRLIVGPRQARICWSDCYDPYQTEMNKVIYSDQERSPYAATLQQGRYDVFCYHGDWHFVRSGDL